MELMKQFRHIVEGIFDQVMLVHLDIPTGSQFEAEMPVKSHGLQHMVEERNARIDGDFPGVVECQLQGNLGLPGFSRVLYCPSVDFFHFIRVSVVSLSCKITVPFENRRILR